jgi:hypothetical protein
VGHTVDPSPSLFWHIDQRMPATAQVVFTLVDGESVDPLVEVVLPAPGQIGIQRVRLDELGVVLDPSTEYTWSVSLVIDPAHRSRDVISSGFIRRVPPASEVERPARAQTLAKLGLWYDALESISDAIEASPGDEGLLRQRSSLLEQADLEISLQ